MIGRGWGIPILQNAPANWQQSQIRPPPPPSDLSTDALRAQNIEEELKLNELQKQAAQWQQHQQSTHVQQTSKELQIIEQEERDFSKQYKEWKKQYEDWKSANKDHPNKDQFQQYEAQWRHYEEQMESRRSDITARKQHVLQNLGSPVLSQIPPDEKFGLLAAQVSGPSTLIPVNVSSARLPLSQIPLASLSIPNQNQWSRPIVPQLSQNQPPQFINQQRPQLGDHARFPGNFQEQWPGNSGWEQSPSFQRETPQRIAIESRIPKQPFGSINQNYFQQQILPVGNPQRPISGFIDKRNQLGGGVRPVTPVIDNSRLPNVRLGFPMGSEISSHSLTEQSVKMDERTNFGSNNNLTESIDVKQYPRVSKDNFSKGAISFKDTQSSQKVIFEQHEFSQNDFRNQKSESFTGRLFNPQDNMNDTAHLRSNCGEWSQHGIKQNLGAKGHGNFGAPAADPLLYGEELSSRQYSHYPTYDDEEFTPKEQDRRLNPPSEYEKYRQTEESNQSSNFGKEQFPNEQFNMEDNIHNSRARERGKSIDFPPDQQYFCDGREIGRGGMRGKGRGPPQHFNVRNDYEEYSDRKRSTGSCDDAIDISDGKLYYDELYEDLPPYEKRRRSGANSTKPNVDVNRLLSGVNLTGLKGDLLSKAAEGLKLIQEQNTTKKYRRVYSAFENDIAPRPDFFDSYLDDPSFISTLKVQPNPPPSKNLETRKTVEQPKEVIDYGHGVSEKGDSFSADTTEDKMVRREEDRLKEKREFSNRHRNYLQELERDRERLYKSGGNSQSNVRRRRRSRSDSEDKNRTKRSNSSSSEDNSFKNRERRKMHGSDSEEEVKEKDIAKWRRERHDIDLVPSGFGRFGPNMKSQPKLKGINVSITDILDEPGRSRRADRIVILIRGAPGSGKSRAAKMIKEREVKNGGTAPRLMSIDDYFINEVEEKVVNEAGKSSTETKMLYDFDSKMEKAYAESLLKAFRKQIDNGYFNFIVVDAVFDKTDLLDRFWSYAKVKGFQVFVSELIKDAELCANRNIHNRSLDDIKKIISGWQPTPKHCSVVDLNPLSEDPIEEVEMEDNDETDIKEKIDVGSNETTNIEVEDMTNWIGYKSSKWELDASEDQLDKLDGLRSNRFRRERSPVDLNDYLQLDSDYYSRTSQSGRKRVRWADIEERKSHRRQKDIGFVIGQTASDWEKMTTDTDIVAERALNKTKYF